jgi:hypothetical protein
MTHDELVAELEALQALIAALLHKLREPTPSGAPQPLSGPGEER